MYLYDALPVLNDWKGREALMRLLASRKQQASEVYPTKNTRLDRNQKNLASLPAILVSRKPTDSDEGKSLFADGLRKE